MKRTLLACMALATLSITSCTKDDNEVQSTPVTKENVAGTYTIASVNMSVNGSPDNNITDAWFPEDCQRDDSYTLQADGAYSINDEGTQCTSTRTPTVGTWDLESSSRINIDGEMYTIKSFNGRSLITSDTYNYNGTSGTLSITFTKK